MTGVRFSAGDILTSFGTVFSQHGHLVIDDTYGSYHPVHNQAQ